ncbi:MAG: biopolymer transporter ExbD [Verrucomicrobiae bacterium]|nr:biopolymer transporter ExbD [Verrucomicrobiae bacterium]
MRFPRHARILRGQFDVAPYVTVFFLVALFMMLGSLVYTPGVRIELPAGDDLPGTDRPMVAVAVDASGRLYYRNQQVAEAELKARLSEAVEAAGEPLTLVVQADKSVRQELLVRLSLLAREAGIHDALLATLPRIISPPNAPPAEP